MKTVKTFTNLAEAGFAASLLESAGIPALLADEGSFTLVPGLANNGIRLQVAEEDFEKAVRVLEEGPMTPVAPASPSPTAADEPDARGKIPAGVFVAAAAALAFLAFAIHQSIEQRRTVGARGEVHTYEHDDNHDGKPDHIFHYRNGRMLKAEVDRNFDGRIDKWEYCDSEGRPERIEFDENFDGRVDGWYFYANGALQRSEHDTDFNGQPDWFYTYEQNVLVRADCRPNGSAIVTRRWFYEHMILREEWVDEDRDGKFDYKIRFDPFGDASERIPIRPGE